MLRSLRLQRRLLHRSQSNNTSERRQHMKNHSRGYKKKALSKQALLATMRTPRGLTKSIPLLNSKRTSRMSTFKCNRQPIQATLHLVLERTIPKQLSPCNLLLNRVLRKVLLLTLSLNLDQLLEQVSITLQGLGPRETTSLN